MRGAIGQHLTYANVISTLCLFLVLGGTSYAAVTLKKNQVRSVHIKDGQVRSKDVRNRSLLAVDFAPGQLTAGPKGDTGASGPAGATGPAGPAGKDGAAGRDGVDGVDGSDGAAGPAGTTGQNATTVFGTSSLTMANSHPVTEIPGLTQTVTVPSGAKTYVATDGGLMVVGTTSGAHVTNDIFVEVDGNAPANGFYRRVQCVNNISGTAANCGWSLQGAMTLTPGSHTIRVVGSAPTSSGNSSIVSGANNSVNQGSLTVAFIKQ